MQNINNHDLTLQEKESMILVLSSLLSIPSVKGKKTADAPYGIHTLHALKYMLDLGRSNGFAVKNLDGRAGYIEWGKGPKMIGLLCHLDVVPAGDGWQNDPFTMRRENGRLIARGINDDKGPAVTIFFAMLRLKNQGFVPPCRIRLILGLDEECGSSCMEHYVQVEELPTCGFTPDADFPVIFAEKGIFQLSISGPISRKIAVLAGERPNMVPARCNLTFKDSGKIIEGNGIPAHASKPHLGKNAIYEAISQLDRAFLENEPLLMFFMTQIGNDTTGQFLLAEKYTDISGALTLNAGVLQMSNDKSELLVDIRYPVTASADVIMSDFQKAASLYGLQVRIASHQKPLIKDPSEPLVQSLLRVYENYVEKALFDAPLSLEARNIAIQKPAVPIAIGGGTYARSMPNLVAFGPSFPWEKEQAHQIDESMNEEMMYLLVQLYQEAIGELCQNI